MAGRSERRPSGAPLRRHAEWIGRHEVAVFYALLLGLSWPYRDAFSFEPPGFLFLDAVKAAVWVLVAVAAVLTTRGLLGPRSSGGSGDVAEGA